MQRDLVVVKGSIYTSIKL